MSEIKNAIIEKTTITIEDHGSLTIWLQLDYGDCGHQGFGGYALYLPKSFKHYKMESVTGHFMFRCMEIAGVEKWSDMQGKTIRVKATHNGVQAIGHIIKNDWFDPKADFLTLEKL